MAEKQQLILIFCPAAKRFIFFLLAFEGAAAAVSFSTVATPVPLGNSTRDCDLSVV